MEFVSPAERERAAGCEVAVRASYDARRTRQCSRSAKTVVSRWNGAMVLVFEVCGRHAQQARRAGWAEKRP